MSEVRDAALASGTSLDMFDLSRTSQLQFAMCVGVQLISYFRLPLVPRQFRRVGLLLSYRAHRWMFLRSHTHFNYSLSFVFKFSHTSGSLFVFMAFPHRRAGRFSRPACFPYLLINPIHHARIVFYLRSAAHRHMPERGAT